MISAMKTSCHIQGLPFSRYPQFAAFAVAERKPINVVFLRGQQVLQFDGHISNHGVLEEITVINNLNSDDRFRLLGAQELVRRLPHRVVRMLERFRNMDWRSGTAEKDFRQRIEIS